MFFGIEGFYFFRVVSDDFLLLSLCNYRNCFLLTYWPVTRPSLAKDAKFTRYKVLFVAPVYLNCCFVLCDPWPYLTWFYLNVFRPTWWLHEKELFQKQFGCFSQSWYTTGINNLISLTWHLRLHCMKLCSIIRLHYAFIRESLFETLLSLKRTHLMNFFKVP
jgi:hypothetical protein